MGLGAKSLNRVCIVVVICYLLLTWSDGGLKIFKFKLRISKIVFDPSTAEIPVSPVTRTLAKKN